ncbi:MAG: ribonuclease P protein component [Xanthomonadales bacterium]|nr:ribonuclease P protein component [Xanthomonadales bacterium]
MKFSRQSRLLKPVEFKSVFKDPIRSDDNYFRILARANSKDLHRLGMAVSKKACARAVDRNRIKRVIRECFRNRIAGQVEGESLDFVVMPKHTAVGETNRMLDNSLNKHWQTLTRKAGDRQTRTQT